MVTRVRFEYRLANGLRRHVMHAFAFADPAPAPAGGGQ